MMENIKEVLINALAEAVVEMEEERTEELAKECIEKGVDVLTAINEGLAKGMEKAGKLYEEGEYYIPELLMCSEAMYKGIDILKPYLKTNNESKFKAVIGVVEGDTHDIGKNLVKIMMETAGFQMYDLGRDVPPMDFVKKAKEVGASIIVLSTLMSTTMTVMEDVIKILEEENLRDKVKVMIGGGPISQKFADKIGADAYTTDATKAAKVAVEIAKNLSKGK